MTTAPTCTQTMRSGVSSKIDDLQQTHLHFMARSSSEGADTHTSFLHRQTPKFMSPGVFTRPGEQSLTMPEYEEKRRRRRMWLAIASALLVAVIVVATLALTVFKARPPRAEINSIDVETVGVGEAGSLTMSLLLDLTLHNPNRARFQREEGVARAWCGGAPVGATSIPPGTVPARADEFLSVLLFLETAPVAGDERVRVGTTTALSGVVKVLGLFKHGVAAACDCDVTVSVANASVLSFFCKRAA